MMSMAHDNRGAGNRQRKRRAGLLHQLLDRGFRVGVFDKVFGTFAKLGAFRDQIEDAPSLDLDETDRIRESETPMYSYWDSKPYW